MKDKRSNNLEPKITSIELTPLQIPFREMVKEAMKPAGGLGMAIPAEEAWLGGDFVICKLVAEDGSIGLGEQFVWLPETGVTPRQIITVIEEALFRYVLGESPFNREHINRRMNSNVARNETAKGLIDMACWELVGRISGRRACDLMGGNALTEVPLAALVPLMEAKAMAEMALTFYQAGMRTVRLKLGKGVQEDVEILKCVRNKLGEGVRIRVDYNQAYAPAEAVRAIKAIEYYQIEFAEQPVGATDFVGMAYVQKRVDTPLMAHEGCFSLQDIVNLIELGAVRVIGVNAERPGGVTEALNAIAYAESHKLGAVIHNQSLGIAAAMQIHLAAARHQALGHDMELFGHVMFEDDLIIDPIDYTNGEAKVPSGLGWGVELDEEALNRYAVANTVKIKTG